MSVYGHGLQSQQQVSLRLRKSPCLHGKEQTDVSCSGLLPEFQTSFFSLSEIYCLVYVYQIIKSFCDQLKLVNIFYSFNILIIILSSSVM